MNLVIEQLISVFQEIKLFKLNEDQNQVHLSTMSKKFATLEKSQNDCNELDKKLQFDHQEKTNKLQNDRNRFE